jgi:miniconductance mechanosensitive channel
MAMLDLFDLRAYQRDGHLSLLAHREQSAYRNSPESDNAPEDAQEKSEPNR